ncbi:MAG: DOMON domain-containing protein [Bacillota bacterium]
MRLFIAVLFIFAMFTILGCESAADEIDEPVNEVEEVNGEDEEIIEPVMAAVDTPPQLDGSGEGFVSVPFQAAGADIYLAHDDEMLYVYLETEVEGWVAIGFNSRSGGMDGANMILGYLEDGSPAYRDDVGQGRQHTEISSPAVGEFYFSNEGGLTVMAFSYPLAFPEDEGYALDGLVTGENYTMIIGTHNSSHDISSPHSSRGKVDFTVEP